jgi:cellulose synthase/poly-beta-1,6-N-acetylglucosamine synthase-like glycosyltransferase
VFYLFKGALPMNSLFYFFLIINVLSWIFLFIFGLHYYVISFMFLSKRKKVKNQVPELGEIPGVTVQLPIFNEMYVVERLIDNVAALDWPKDKLEIQILDDSNDETTEIARKKVEEYRNQGINIHLIRREDRSEFKAGALKYGLGLTPHSLLAIFDADFLPEKDFLLKTVPHFLKDDKIAFIQTRWGHVNRNYSAFTAAQALGIDGHFVVEQSARNFNNLWMNFNGTAGIWRKEAIVDAGNWSGDTLTEDLDLSYRVQLKGWKCVYLPDVECPAEIPVQLMPYKSQQFRWAKGSIQTAKKLLPNILKAKAPLKSKLEAMIHVTYYSVHFLMFINILTLLPMLILKTVPRTDSLIPPFVLATVSMMAPVFLAITAQLQLKRGFWQAVKTLPYMFLIGLGITVHISIAFIQAIFGKKKGVFIRTPKMNIKDGGDKKELVKRKYKSKLHYTVFLEVLFSVFCFFEVYLIARFHSPIFLFFPFIMGISGLYMAGKAIQDRLVFRG